MILFHVQEQPLRMMQKVSFDKQIGGENFCENIDAALEKAARLQRVMTAIS